MSQFSTASSAGVADGSQVFASWPGRFFSVGNPLRSCWVRMAFLTPMLWMVSLLGTDSVQAQLPVEVGETVQIQFLGDWHEGVAIDTNKQKQVLVEFVWGAGTQQRVFNRREVLREYEVGCMDFGRIWTSTAGTKIEAALKSFEGDKLTLSRPDLEEIVVLEDKLSNKDVAYAKKIKANYKAAVNRGAVAAKVPDLPELEQFAGGGSYSMFAQNGAERVELLGQAPSFLKFKQAGAGIELVRREQDLVSVIPVGGPEQLVLMGTGEDYMGSSPFPSQLYWVSLEKRKVLGKLYVSPAHLAMDYDPKSRRLLTFHPESFFDHSGAPGQYVLWDLKPGGTDPIPVKRWRADGMEWERDYFAKIVDKDTVVAKTAKHTYTGWNVDRGEEIYRFESASFFDAPVSLTRDRSHLIVPEDGNVSVVDARTGDFTMSLNVDAHHVSGANVNAEGTRLAAITESKLYVWDLDSGSVEPRVFSAPLIASPFQSRLDWIDDNHILGENHQGRVLFSLEHEIPVWSYRVELRHYFENKDPLKNFVLDGKYFYVARPDFSNVIAVGAIELPGPNEKEIIQDIDRESLLIVKAGTRVGLDIKIDNPGNVQDWLLKKIERNAWVYDPSAEIRLVATMGIGEMQQVTYQEFGGGATTQASFRPHYSRLQLTKGQQVLWQSGTSTGPPPIVRGDAQSEINRMQKPNYQFFEAVYIEPEILDPKYSRGFGESVFGLRGLRVVSTNPPGRSDDPYEAEREAQAQENKDRQSQRQQSQQ